MPVTEIIVVRHAARHDWIVDTIDKQYLSAQKNPTGIPTDPSLTSHGISQSHEVAVAMDQLLTSPSSTNNLVVFSTPFYRCLQTIAPTIRKLRQRDWSGKVYLELGFGEWFGTDPLEHPPPADPASLQAHHFDFVHPTYQSQGTFTSGPESYDQLRARTETALASAADHAESLDGNSSDDCNITLVIAAHTAVVIMIGRILTDHWPENQGEQEFQCFLAGISQFKRRLPEGNWEVLQNSDTTHLSSGAEGGWYFGAPHVQDQRIVRGKDGRRTFTNDYCLK